MEQMISIKSILAALIFTLLGLGVLTIVWKVFDRCTPGNLWEEIIEKKNLPLAVVVSAMTLAVAQIIAASIQG